MSFAAIPSQLRALPRWVCYRLERGGSSDRVAKVPYHPSGYRAKSNDPATWTSFDRARAALADGRYDGLGFELGDGIFGVDLDGVVQNGSLSDLARGVVETLDSYTEYSPSGTGVHVLCRGCIPDGERRRSGVEMYGEGRFFTVTGRVIGGRSQLRERTEEAAIVHAQYLRGQAAAAVTRPMRFVANCEDSKLIAKACENPRFKALWQGDCRSYDGDFSRADLALLNDLAYWTHGDAVRMDSLYRQSGLLRGKWDKRRGVSTYGQLTIAKAIEGYASRQCVVPLTRHFAEAIGIAPLTGECDVVSVCDLMPPTYGSVVVPVGGHALLTSGPEQSVNMGQGSPLTTDCASVQMGDPRLPKGNCAAVHVGDHTLLTVEGAVTAGLGTSGKSQSFDALKAAPKSTPSNAFLKAVPVNAPQTPQDEIGPPSQAKYLAGQFRRDVGHLRASQAYRTGFDHLDAVSGGLRPGLTVLGATTSLGKTTFALQLCDQVASQGGHALYFTLEQTRFELTSKSLSRVLRQVCGVSASALEIRNGSCGDALDAAMRAYQPIAERVHVYEGDRDAASIAAEVDRFVATHPDVKPFVVVDYLQIIAASHPRQSDKERVDAAVRALKQLQLAHQIPLLVVSSFNRANYLSAVDFESFKESGGIEYTADVVWGLQFQGQSDAIHPEDRGLRQRRAQMARKRNPRKMELVCLKNRYGLGSYACSFVYDARFDTFAEE